MHTKTIDQQHQNPPQSAGSERSHSKAVSIPINPSDEEARWLNYKNELYPLVHGYVQKLVSDPAVTEEVTLLAFRRLWENRHSVSGEKQVLAFLFMVARTRVMNRIRLKTTELQRH
ncbi:MAG: sigma factor [Bacteroidota bacterium]|nr:sigma factor [Bacteroidota bacterium]MDP4218263.1 sigma factor [Bacteroidota bacterium]MDP4260820.1 sigma factor [Bacteroidota bacterium]